MHFVFQNKQPQKLHPRKQHSFKIIMKENVMCNLSLRNPRSLLRAETLTLLLLCIPWAHWQNGPTVQSVFHFLSLPICHILMGWV